eukprot:1952070-Alexandrium_andersonii.AAC.1
MRHLERTHNCSVKWLHEQHDRGLYKLNKIDTNFQAADVVTKPFTDGKKWKERPRHRPEDLLGRAKQPR